MSLASNRGTIEERAFMLAKVRQFFSKRGVLEVDTPILSAFAPIDAHIDVMEVSIGNQRTGYLHTSPEYGMKKLLAQGSPDIYQLSHVFRKGEEGPLHSPEFTMLEWYRIGMDLQELMKETCELLSLFCDPLPIEMLTYREAFEKYASLDPFGEDWKKSIEDFSAAARDWDRDTQLDLLFSHLVEPKLGRETFTILTQFPASQAALAKTIEIDGMEVANRFEIYFAGIELANGFDELSDPQEQKRRFEEQNQKRMNLKKDPLPADPEFLQALKTLPDCVGVAVGFDRLMKLSTAPTSAQSENAGRR